MEYANVRIVLAPVTVFTNVPNSVFKSSFACATERETVIQSPAGEMVLAEIPFSVSHAFTASTLSGLGAMYCSTCRDNDEDQNATRRRMEDGQRTSAFER